MENCFWKKWTQLCIEGTARPSWFRVQCHNDGGIAFHLPALKGASSLFPLCWGMRDS